jgi:DNA (cytosine-5)-methyltransferase 1
MAGHRENKWDVKTKFAEGQADQRLDDLFFHFVETARILQPRVVVAENVKGMLAGNAKGYVLEVVERLRAVGYTTQIFLLNAAVMGVPQRRDRVFFIAQRGEPVALSLVFDERQIGCEEAFQGIDPVGDPLSDASRERWKFAAADGWFPYDPKVSGFNYKCHPLIPSRVMNTSSSFGHWSSPNHISQDAHLRLQTFPDDYDWAGSTAKWLCGMSVPPYMMQRLSGEIRRQVFGIE